jgi:deoxyribonuclease-4
MSTGNRNPKADHRKPNTESRIPKAPRPALKPERDILLQPPPKCPPRHTSRRIGIHTSIAGGVQNAAERAYRLGCNAFQIFSTSPRQWRPYETSLPQCDQLRRLREKYDLYPLAIHVNYLVNLAAQSETFLKQSVVAFRGELERALAIGAEYLVLHPGSFRGMTREQGLTRASAAIAAASRELDLAGAKLTILIENTAGAEFSLGGSFEQVAEMLGLLGSIVPVGACIDTCHTHVSGYDIVSAKGMRETLRHLDETVGLKNVHVWHCNDAKCDRGSKLDRHEHVGKGKIGSEAFRRLLNDPRTARAAFIAETPIDRPGDDRRNVEALKALVKATRRA